MNFTKARKKSEKSLYSQVDELFKKIGADRAAYHDGMFNGINMRTIMEHSEELFGKNGCNGSVRDVLHKSDIHQVGKKIDDVCDNVGLALRLWDAAFSAVHKVDPDNSDCDEAQKLIDLAVAQLRRMDISITPKAHGMEKHCVSQMRSVKGGIGKLVEHWVERYHQDGFRYDLAYCRAGSLSNQAATRSKLEARARDPRVILKKAQLKKRFQGQRKRKKTALQKEERCMMVKAERQKGALMEIVTICRHRKNWLRLVKRWRGGNKKINK